MEGVTTAIVLFIFTCVAIPSLVKHKPQFYAAVGLVLLIILLNAIAATFVTVAPKFNIFLYVAAAVCQMLAIVTLFMSCGGVSPRQFGGEMLNVIELMRRGESEKEIIVPLSGQPGKRPDAVPRARADDEPAERYVIDDDLGDVSLRRPASSADVPRKDASPIPLEHPPEDRPRA